ncbi:MAG: hypothetical protein K0Q85_597 [Caproiciproducens sp.]|nr:hypothetical protein [Caproiciproducens sp.]
MKKPENMWKLCGTLFLILGTVFLFSGVLSRMGILHTDPASQGDPKIWFPVLGCILLFLGAIMYAISYRKEKAYKLLLCEGTKTKGHVTAVKQWFFTRVNGSYPYVVYFTYEIEGFSYKGKSHLLWSQPEVREQNIITVYIDSQKPAHYAVDL